MKKQNIEVEGGELLIQSKEGHYAIIPAKHRQEVMDMVKAVSYTHLTLPTIYSV